MKKEKETRIEELTTEQELKIDIYTEKYTTMGLSTASINHEKAESAFRKAYESQKMKAPQVIEWFASPLAMLVCAGILERAQEIITDEGKSFEVAEKEASLEFDITKMLSDSSQKRIRDLLNVCCYGQHDANWLGWIDFFKTETEVGELDDTSGLIETVEAAHWWLPFENACLASERPIEMHLTEPDAEGNRNLHRDGGPAMSYSDGFSLWVLNGIDVPEWLIMKKPEELDAKEILSLTNAEQRKEGIRKMGIDRMREPLKVQILDRMELRCTDMDKLLQLLKLKKYSPELDYELWTIEFEGRRIGPYLKMVNDSTGQIHVEGVGDITDTGVDTKIKTCREALAWRGGFEKYEDAGWTA